MDSNAESANELPMLENSQYSTILVLEHLWQLIVHSEAHIPNFCFVFFCFSSVRKTLNCIEYTFKSNSNHVKYFIVSKPFYQRFCNFQINTCIYMWITYDICWHIYLESTIEVQWCRAINHYYSVCRWTFIDTWNNCNVRLSMTKFNVEKNKGAYFRI